jgi:hypothetical protein
MGVFLLHMFWDFSTVWRGLNAKAAKEGRKAGKWGIVFWFQVGNQ